MVDAYSTFSGFGFRALQVGRQKIPVVRTQAKNRPSNDRSRSTSARYISAGVGINIMRSGYEHRALARYRKMDSQFSHMSAFRCPFRMTLRRARWDVRHAFESYSRCSHSSQPSHRLHLQLLKEVHQENNRHTLSILVGHKCKGFCPGRKSLSANPVSRCPDNVSSRLSTTRSKHLRYPT